MAKFNGFSQDEIHQIHSRTGIQNTTSKAAATRLRTTKLTGKLVHNAKTLAQTKSANNPLSVVPAESNNNNNDTFESNGTIISLQDAVHFQPLQAKKSLSTDSNHSTEEELTSKHNNDAPNDMILGGKVDLHTHFQGISLKDFEQHRKLVEEQNKQKKELITKAIEQRIERTAAETKRIAEVKEELNKLDVELATDVAILRKEIEAVSLQYAQIQKSYQQIESQFLKAKFELHMASERKELLTEHLCTIISHNEDRKAKKLSELMEKVGLPSTDDAQH